MTPRALRRAALPFVDLFAILAGLSIFAGAAPAGATQDVAGTWLTEDGEGAVRLRDCAGSTICGHIVWLKDPVDLNGRPAADDNNTDASLRSRPLCGVEVVHGLKPAGTELWDGGRIYDPETGRSYDLAIRRKDADTLELTGYIGVKAIGKTLVWQRAPKNLAVCGGAPTRARQR